MSRISKVEGSYEKKSNSDIKNSKNHSPTNNSSIKTKKKEIKRPSINYSSDEPPQYCCLSESNQCNCCFFTLFSLNFYHSKKRSSKKFNYKCMLCGKGCCRPTSNDFKQTNESQNRAGKLRKNSALRNLGKKTNNSYASSLRVYENSGHLNVLRNVYTYLLKKLCCLFYFLMPCVTKKCCIQFCCSSIHNRQNQNVLDDIDKTSIYFKEENELDDKIKDCREKSNYDIENQLEHVHVSTATMDNFYFVEHARDNAENSNYGDTLSNEYESADANNNCKFCFSSSFFKCLCDSSVNLNNTDNNNKNKSNYYNKNNNNARLKIKKKSPSIYSSKSNNS